MRKVMKRFSLLSLLQFDFILWRASSTSDHLNVHRMKILLLIRMMVDLLPMILEERNPMLVKVEMKRK